VASDEGDANCGDTVMDYQAIHPDSTAPSKAQLPRCHLLDATISYQIIIYQIKCRVTSWMKEFVG
jgi:hypothetical protein